MGQNQDKDQSPSSPDQANLEDSSTNPSRDVPLEFTLSTPEKSVSEKFTSEASSFFNGVSTSEKSTPEASSSATFTSKESNPPPLSLPSEASYDAKTQRIAAWGNLFQSIQPLIWAAIILIVVIPLLGKVLLSRSSSVPMQRTVQASTEVIVPTIPKRADLDKALVEAIESAHQNAQAFAKSELDDWEMVLEGRVDDFLDWYFGYFNQKKMELMTPFVWVSAAAMHRVNPKRIGAGEAVTSRFTEEFQKQFAKQVLVPQNAQIRLENLTTETVNLYLNTLSQNIEQVPAKYRIPQGQWDRYLADISTTIQDTEGSLSNLSLKMLVGGSSYLLAKPLVLATVGKIGGKISSKVAGTAAAKLAAKTGGTVAAELGTSLVDPIVGIGIFIWDIWDYHHTVELERPILKANLLEYLQAVEQSLLNDPETGVLSAIAQLERSIFQSL